LAVNDNEEIRTLALGYLEKAIGEREREQVELRHRRMADVWGTDLPFVSKDLLLVLGPPFDSARCAGSGRGPADGCFTTWRAWAETLKSAGD
jgi:hypothetical protein